MRSMVWACGWRGGVGGCTGSVMAWMACGLAGLRAGVGWYNVRKRVGDCGSNGGTTNKRGGMYRKRRKKAGYTTTETLVA